MRVPRERAVGSAASWVLVHRMCTVPGPPDMGDSVDQQPTVLVTGAGGFIGHHLTRYLVDKGYWVRGVDIKPPEYEPHRVTSSRSWTCAAGRAVCRRRAASTTSTTWPPTWAASASSKPTRP